MANQPPKMQKPRGLDFDAATLQALAKLRDAVRLHQRAQKEVTRQMRISASSLEGAVRVRMKAEAARAMARAELEEMLKEDN